MNTGNTRDELEDRRVQRAYRALPPVRTPVELDDAVLAEAAAAHRGGRVWLGPMAFAATTILGVALLFEMTDQPMPEATPGAHIVAPDEAQVLEKEAPQDAPATDTIAPAVRGKPSRPAAKFAADSRAEHGGAETATRDTRELLDDASPARSRKSTLAAPSPAVSRYCDATQTTDADGWWHCIVLLREAGKAAEADVELASLLKRYPEFAGHLD